MGCELKLNEETRVTECLFEQGVTPAHTAAAMGAMIKEFQDLATGTRPITEAELIHEVSAMKGELGNRFRSNNSTLWHIRNRITRGLPLVDDTYAELEALTVAQVNAQATAHLRPGRVKVLVTGDRATVWPQLEAYAQQQTWATPVDVSGGLAGGWSGDMSADTHVSSTSND